MSPWLLLCLLALSVTQISCLCSTGFNAYNSSNTLLDSCCSGMGPGVAGGAFNTSLCATDLDSVSMEPCTVGTPGCNPNGLIGVALCTGAQYGCSNGCVAGSCANGGTCAPYDQFTFSRTCACAAGFFGPYCQFVSQQEADLYTWMVANSPVSPWITFGYSARASLCKYGAGTNLVQGNSMGNAIVCTPSNVVANSTGSAVCPGGVYATEPFNSFACPGSVMTSVTFVTLGNELTPLPCSFTNVTALSIQNANMTHLQTDLVNFGLSAKNLQTINIVGANSVTASIPTQLALLTSLTSLILKNLGLVGTIPTVLPFSGYTTIDLRGNNLVGPIPAGLLSNTHTKNLYANKFDCPIQDYSAGTSDYSTYQGSCTTWLGQSTCAAPTVKVATSTCFTDCLGAHPCLNGTCAITAGTGATVCACNTGFSGTLCDAYVNCASSPCQNGATCVDHPSTFNYSCLCDSLTMGPTCGACKGGLTTTSTHCDTDNDVCSVVACAAGSTNPPCYPNNHTIVCNCTNPANNCGTNCSVTPCLNGGTCTSYNSSTTARYCACPAGFFGVYCAQTDLFTRDISSWFLGFDMSANPSVLKANLNLRNAAAAPNDGGRDFGMTIDPSGNTRITAAFYTFGTPTLETVPFTGVNYPYNFTGLFVMDNINFTYFHQDMIELASLGRFTTSRLTGDIQVCLNSPCLPASLTLPTEMAVYTSFAFKFGPNMLTGSLPPFTGSGALFQAPDNSLQGTLPTQWAPFYLDVPNNYLAGSIPSLIQHNVTFNTLRGNYFSCPISYGGTSPDSPGAESDCVTAALGCSCQSYETCIYTHSSTSQCMTDCFGAHPCQQGGVCTQNSTTYFTYCACPSGTSGPLCAAGSPPTTTTASPTTTSTSAHTTGTVAPPTPTTTGGTGCSGYNCSSTNGECVSRAGIPYCFCFAGFYGANCEFTVNCTNPLQWGPGCSEYNPCSGFNLGGAGCHCFIDAHGNAVAECPVPTIALPYTNISNFVAATFVTTQQLFSLLNGCTPTDNTGCPALVYQLRACIRFCRLSSPLLMPTCRSVGDLSLSALPSP